MASKDPLTAKFAEFCDPKTNDQFNTKACHKFVKDCLEPSFKVKDLSNRIDSSVFPKCKEDKKQYMIVNKTNCEKFIKRAAFEIAKLQGKDSIKEDDPKVQDLIPIVTEKVIASKGKTIQATKTSKTGGVGKLTDASQYTGAHKERFNADGTGKGIEGRETLHDGSGYVGGYKGQNTFDAKTK